MPLITVGSEVIDFPNSGTDPNWAPAVIAYAQAVANQLQAQASPFDVPPKVQILTSDSNVNLNLTDAIFPSGSVRSFSMYYTIFRTNTVDSVLDQGEVYGSYNSDTTAWVLSEKFNGTRQDDGLPYQSFNMSGDQLQLNTVAIGGSYDSVNSTISFSAKTELATE